MNVREAVEKMEKTAKIEENFEARVSRHREEADRILDGLTELSVRRLHEMAGGEGTLDERAGR